MCMGFRTALKILEAWQNYEYFGLIVYGPLRCGKSVFSIKLLAQVYGETRVTNDENGNLVLEVLKPNWEAWKEWMVFFPEEFFEKVDQVQKTGRQQKMIVWDDAGLWASQYRWSEEFAKRLSEYFNVAASDFASIVFTTPDPRWLLKYIRDLPGGHTGRPIKVTGNPRQRDLRLIRIYEGWIAPDLKKSGVNPIVEDQFSVRLPDDVFREYDAVRRSYARVAKERCMELIKEMRFRAPNYAESFKEKMEEFGLEDEGDDRNKADG